MRFHLHSTADDETKRKEKGTHAKPNKPHRPSKPIGQDKPSQTKPKQTKQSKPQESGLTFIAQHMMRPRGKSRTPATNARGGK